MDKEPGFYWVHIKDNFHDEWTIGEYGGKDNWTLIDSDDFYTDKYFYEIGSKIERVIDMEREEKDQEIHRLKSKLSEYDTLLKKVRPIIGAFAAQASNGPLREARTKIYKEIEDALPKCS